MNAPAREPQDREELLGAAEVQEILGISTATYYRWLKDGRLPGKKVGARWRFRREDVEALRDDAWTPEADAGAVSDAVELLAEHLGHGLREVAPDENAGSMLLDALLEGAIAQGATELELAPQLDGVRVRERVDGVLVPLPRLLSPELLDHLLLAVRDRADMTGQRGRPQVGRMFVPFEERRVEVRLATYPTSLGDSVTMRILDPQRIVLDLDQLRLPPRVVTGLRGVLARPNGVLLVNGPTDSGKTTTLYCMLASLVSPAVKVMTVEDPVELHLDGVLQAEVSESMSFEDGMLAMLRNHLDVGLVSELRTTEAIELLFKMARTGHLMLSALHARDGVAAIDTLLTLAKIPPRFITENLRCVLTQRLLPRLCAKCRKPLEITREERTALGVEDADARSYRCAGCAHCRGTGVRGRELVAEWLPMTDELRNAILAEGAPAHGIRAIFPGPQPSLPETLRDLVLAGKLSAAVAMQEPVPV